MRFGQLAVCLFALTIAGSPITDAQTPALLLFGGSAHDTFLGCLNCNRYDANSVCNRYGDYGSKYATDSVWNRYGDFGSKYSDSSPWNRYTGSAPVIVDQSGNFYGHLSANKYHSNRTQIALFNQLVEVVVEQDDLDKARDIYCND
jgi:hypothetical protein